MPLKKTVTVKIQFKIDKFDGQAEVKDKLENDNAMEMLTANVA